MSLLSFPFDFRNIKKLPDRSLGAGANGTCYVGIDLSNHGKLFAVKEIPLTSSSSSSPFNALENNNNNNDSRGNEDPQKIHIAKNLLTEISICSGIPPHPNVVTYFGSRISQVVNNPFGSDFCEVENDKSMISSNSSCIDIIMEYCPGGSVSSVLRSLNHHNNNQNSSVSLFPESLTKRYMADLLLGVDHLHNVAHVVHRDLKGDNLLLDLTGENAKVCDYGTATKRFATSKNKRHNKKIDNPESVETVFDLISPGGDHHKNVPNQNSTSTCVGKQSLLFKTACGTASWTAPEVASAEFSTDGNIQENQNDDDANDDEEDQREKSVESQNGDDKTKCVGYSSSADIWSIGCCAFEFLTGSPPSYGLDSSNQFAIFFAIATNETLRPDLDDPAQVPSETLRRQISAEAKDFVMNCCCLRDPKKRWRVEQLLQHPWVKKEVEEKKKKIVTSIVKRPESAVTPATTTKNLGLSLSMDEDHDKTVSEQNEDECQGTKMFRDSVMSATSTGMVKTSGEGFMMANGAFVDM